MIFVWGRDRFDANTPSQPRTLYGFRTRCVRLRTYAPQPFRRCSSARLGPVLGKERLNLLERLVAGDRVALLDQATEFLLMAIDLQQFVFGQFAPGDLGGADTLSPSAPEFCRTG